ncbi:MAG TPA: aldehyde dehydrogenase family protein [Candidatus Eisenbacteria bacterium]|jgi:aldehyde dehydrogenase (NAD+)|nr:aldehyde dehydrogenase family protein [Candidatus Eisenbacteria bacterium]
MTQAAALEFANGVPKPLPSSPATYRNFIGGKWREARADRSTPNTNPADTRQVLGQVPLSPASDVADAVKAAHAALPAWRETPTPLRGRILYRLVELMERHKAELATILTLEEGKTFGESMGEVSKSINVVEFYAGEGRRLGGETLPSEMPSTFCYTVRQPLGVVAVITPWNFPVAIPCWKMAPALISGNTIVFKPASLTPWTAARLVELMAEAGVPEGVVNLVYGSGSTIGDALIGAEEVRGVTFTGSNEVGAQVYAAGARRLLKVQCEMGGKNPIVVLDDADIELAAVATAQGAFGSTGQRCTATSRAVIMAGVADEFVKRVTDLARNVRVGNGLAAGIAMGPSVDKGQFGTVLDYIATGDKEGSQRVIGGRKLDQGDHEHGFFVEPTVFDHVKADSRLAQEEIFGPVLSVIRVNTPDEAIEAANNVKFGLSSSVYTNDVARAFRFVDRIETGIVHVNSPTVGGEAQLPFGGMKGTGVGSREQGKAALEFFTEIKTTYLDYTGKKRDTNIY